ncbi:Hypothetical protein [Arabidopsis thaliana]|uniref:F2J6.10 protein n=1 Tax=Arabidopsis thaliana TaxID=3702 RepID=Q9MA71_ARATH|nr:Hypothetical protein [Arabidopsis thaliana]
MTDEYDAMTKTKSWNLVPRPPQEHGVDFTETFSPVVKPATIRDVLDVGVALNLPIQQLDVKNALLQGDLNETVYMHQPPSLLTKSHSENPYTTQRRVPNDRHGTLVTLYIHAEFIVDYVPLTISFRSLKILSLYLVKFSSGEILDSFLSGYPLLEDLLVVRGSNDNVKTFNIAVPSLRILSIIDLNYGSHGLRDDVGFVIKAPSMNSLTITTHFFAIEWIGYKGIQVEKNVVMYLLENSPQLKTMAIRSLKWSNDSEKLKMMQELSSMQRTSTKYRLSFT